MKIPYKPHNSPRNTHGNRDSDLNTGVQRGAIHRLQKAKALEHLPGTVTAGIRLITISILVFMTWEIGRVL